MTTGYYQLQYYYIVNTIDNTLISFFSVLIVYGLFKFHLNIFRDCKSPNYCRITLYRVRANKPTLYISLHAIIEHFGHF